MRRVLQAGGLAAFMGASILLIRPLRGMLEGAAFWRESSGQPTMTPFIIAVHRKIQSKPNNFTYINNCYNKVNLINS